MIVMSFFFSFSFIFGENSKSAFSNSFGLRSIFKKLCFRDGLVWPVSLTVEIKLRFQVSPTWSEWPWTSY